MSRISSKKKMLVSFHTINGTIKVSRYEGEKTIIGHINDLYDLCGQEEVASIIYAHKNRSR